MHILSFTDGDQDHTWLCFETLEDGREFLSLLPGYHFTSDEIGIDSEWIDIKELPDFQEIEFRGNIIPISRFMFKNLDSVDLFFIESTNLSIRGHGMIEGTTIIDAYAIPNDEVKSYVETREKAYGLVKEYLEEKGMQVERSFHGSEDGEAIIYKQKSDEEWHFLTHLDPCFVNLYEEGEESVRESIDYLIE